jgi:amidohydrolase
LHLGDPLQNVMSALLTRLLALIEHELAPAIELRHRLHSAPELAYEEHQTAGAVSEALGIAARPIARTGLIATFGRAGGPVMVRAELDGLPVAERTTVAYRSRNGAMHACAHDVHAAALVAFARAARRIEDDLPAQLAVLFQPSEEAFPSGAERIVRESLAGERPHSVVAAHAHPDVAWGSLAIDPGPVNASTDNVEITVDGASAHAAYPHKARDPVLALAQIVVGLHAAVGRRFDPLSPVVLTVGELRAGSAQNIIPAQARARATLRALEPDDRAELRALVGEVAQAIAKAHGCEAGVELIAGEPALDNDPAITARARDLSAGAGLRIAPPWRSCGSDDFSFFSEIAPVAMGFVGLRGAPGFAQRPLHHPEFLPPDDAVGAVARAQAILYFAAADAAARADAR